MGKSKELSKDVRILNLHTLGRSLLNKCNWIVFLDVSPLLLPRTERRTNLSPSDERKLVRMFRKNPESPNIQACHELTSAGTPASLSIVKPLLHHHGEGADQERSPCSKINTFKLDWNLQIPTRTRHMPYEEKNVLSDKTEIKLFDYSDNRCVWSKGKASTLTSF